MVVIEFAVAPFFATRQFYYGIETSSIDTGSDIDGNIDIEYHHSPRKDQVLVCGSVDAATMSMGKYLFAKIISHTDTIPADPMAIAAGLTFERGNGLFVPANSPIQTPEDLRGARLGIHDRSVAMVYHTAVLVDRFGLSLDEIEWVVDTHQGLTKRLKTGTIDAIERVNDLYWDCRTGEDTRLIYDIAPEWKELAGSFPLVHVIAVNGDRFDVAGQRIEAFRTALQASRSYRDRNHEHVIEQLVDETGDRDRYGPDTVSNLVESTARVRCPLVLDESHRESIRTWLHYADRFDVLDRAAIDEDRLFPDGL